ncbi:MAG: helix-turn-helix transcriptional regulator [Lentisphaerae bacterium]|nr:helix-turn-helix transcriptional regulator [Lentisphaerota bacterium]
MVSYNKLWKMMIDCGLNKTQLREKAGITTNAIAKMGKGEKVSMDVLIKICTALNCNIGDIIDVLPPK